jgi:hypothetical protein
MNTNIPFRILNIDGEGFHLMVRVLVNGKAASLIIDTGASKTVFDNSRIEKYVKDKNFDTHDKLSSGLGTNSMTSQITTIKKLKIGDIEIADYRTVLLDLSHVNNSYDQVGLKPVEGVLGGDILVQYKAVIDYEKKMLRLNYSKKKTKAKSLKKQKRKAG